MTEPYDHSIQIALLAALLDTLKLESVHVCGISYGAKVGLGFAVNYPERVKRLLLFNGSARMPPLLTDMNLAWNEAAKLEGGYAYYHATIPVIYSDLFYEKQKEWFDKRKGMLVPYFGMPGVKDALVRLTNSSMNFNVVDKLSVLNMPVLVVSAKNDNLIPLREQELMVHNIKKSHHVILPECGHASMFERPLLFSSLVLGFINSKNCEFTI